MNNYFLIQMILVIIQTANFMWAVFFAANPFTIMFAGVVLAFICVMAYSTWKNT